MPQKESGTLFPGGIPEGYMVCEGCGTFWPEKGREFHRIGCEACRPEPQFSPEMVEPEDIEELETHPTAGHIRLSSRPRPDVFEEIRCRFTAHPPTRDQAERHKLIRSSATQLANLVASIVPESREQSLALTKLEEVMMWANAGIARRL